MYVQNIRAGSAFPDVALVTDFEIGARAKGVGSSPREDNDADRRICATEFESVDQFHDRLRPEGIAHLGSIDRDLGDALVRAVEQQILVLLYADPCFHFDFLAVGTQLTATFGAIATALTPGA